MGSVLTILGILLAFAALTLLVLAASAVYSFDRTYRHTAATRALPELAPGTPSGLVRIAANGLEFRARVAGLDTDGPGLMLLHGFPETSAMYLPLIDAAATAGYRVVAFDQRGYSPGARPSDVDSYRVPALLADALAVADAVGFDRFHVVAHDWGSAVGWAMVLEHPERVSSWTSLSIPHVAAFAAGLAADPDQRRRSRYMLFFRMPWLPELLFMFNRQALPRRGYAPMPDAAREEYLAVFAEPGAITAALNWYRAAGRQSLELSIDPHTAVPYLFIWGNQDPAVSRNSVNGQRPYITGPLREIELDAGHWLMEEETTTVVRAVLEHLQANDPTPPVTPLTETR